MNRAILLALCPALFAAGRLELFHAPANKAEEQIGGTFDLGSAKVGDSATARFRIRNIGDGPVTLTKLYIAGTGFSSTGSPSLPHIVAAGTNVDFTARFSPPDYGSYSALLYVNGATYVLKALGEAAVTLLSNGAVLTAGDTVDFGRLERGQSATRSLELRNLTASALAVSQPATGSPVFEAGPVPSPLQPGESARFDVTIRATATGIYKTTLTVDRREFNLTATVFDPPMPRPTLVIESAALRSGQQGRIAVHLSEPARTSGAGTLGLELQPSGAARDNDDAMRFVRGSRTVPFEVKQGDTLVRFGDEDALTFQTGTTAGTIVFTVATGGYTDRASVVIQPEAVRVDKAWAVRGATAIDVRLNGFDNTRSIENMSFTFHLNNGQSVPVKAPVSADFSRWWSESKLGGVFGFRASFPVTGDASQIAGVEVEIVNSAGSTRTERLTF